MKIQTTLGQDRAEVGVTGSLNVLCQNDDVWTKRKDGPRNGWGNYPFSGSVIDVPRHYSHRESFRFSDLEEAITPPLSTQVFSVGSTRARAGILAHNGS